MFKYLSLMVVQSLLVAIALPILATATELPASLSTQDQVEDFPPETSRRGSGRREVVGVRILDGDTSSI